MALSKQAKEEAILDAASRVFREKGYMGATLRDIAAEAGMLLGSLQYRFETKDALFLALVRREIERLDACVAAFRASAHEPIERIRLFLLSHTRQIAADNAAVVWLVGTQALAPAAKREMKALQDRHERVIDALLDDARRAGALRLDVDSALFRNFLFGPFILAFQRLGDEEAPSPEALLDTYWTLFLQGITPPD